MEEQQTEIRQQDTVIGDEHIQKQTVKTDQSVPGTVFAKRLIYYIAGIILALLGLRFLLLLLGASQSSGFVNFIYSLSNIFVAPFNGIFAKPSYGTSTFDTATLVAMIVYALLAFGIAKLMTLGDKHPEEA